MLERKKLGQRWVRFAAFEIGYAVRAAVCFSLMILAFPTHAADQKNSVGVSLGSESVSFELKTFSVRYERNLFSFFSDHLQLNGGLRLNNFSSNNGHSLGGDSWKVDKIDVSSLNMFGGVVFWFAEKGAIVMNLDLIGFSSGSEVGLTHPSNPSDNATPVAQNVFLYGRKDRGTLNSEFFFQYSLTEQYRLRIGLSHLVVEYDSKDSDTDKLQRFFNVAVLGLDYSF